MRLRIFLCMVGVLFMKRGQFNIGGPQMIFSNQGNFILAGIMSIMETKVLFLTWEAEKSGLEKRF